MIVREERIGGQRLILGDCMAVMPTLGRFDHVICDPPYEASLHAAKASPHQHIRTDGGTELKALRFSGIDDIRQTVGDTVSQICDGWFIAFCTVEGVAPWADTINASAMKYKRACIWVKVNSAPQFNGQGPAQGAECFVTAWGGKGHARWNGGGKAGIYTHTANPPNRHGGHPTEKPVRLMSALLADFTNEGQMVLDPFMGSGTTLVACQKMGRAGTGIELDPAYFQMACDRVHAAWMQPDMFVELAAKVKQEAFL